MRRGEQQLGILSNEGKFVERSKNGKGEWWLAQVEDMMMVGGEEGALGKTETYTWVDKTTRCKTSKHEE